MADKPVCCNGFCAEVCSSKIYATSGYVITWIRIRKLLFLVVLK